MSVSTDAILAYGVDLGDQEVPVGFDEWAVTPIVHCSDGYPMKFLALLGFVFSARRGYPEKIDLLRKPEAVKIKILTEFIAKHNLEPVGKPGWYLFSYWG